MEAVGRLAAGVAHDFEPLLATILSPCGTLLEQLPRGDARRAAAAAIEEAAERAATLARQLSTFGRRSVLDLRVVDLNAVVSDTAPMLHRLLDGETSLVLRLATGLRRVRVDPYQLSQALINLVVNAREAMPSGGRVTIETGETLRRAEPGPHEHESAGERFVTLAVSDTGLGMPGEVTARVFEPFYTTKGTGKSRGLGLAVVHGIVAQCGGLVEVASERGRGTTLRILLPSVAPAADEIQVADPVAEPIADLVPRVHERVVDPRERSGRQPQHGARQQP
jgi:signal transduction histidine kinase